MSSSRLISRHLFIPSFDGPSTTRHSPLFSITYELPNFQVLCFDNDATVGWGVGGTRPFKHAKMGKR